MRSKPRSVEYGTRANLPSRRCSFRRRWNEEERKPVDKCCDYLLKNQRYLRYNEYLAQGLPIATGVIGEEHQMEKVLAEARARHLAITIVLDLIHVIHYLWMAGHALCSKDPRATEQWVRVFLERLLTGQASFVAAAIRRQATVAELSEARR